MGSLARMATPATLGLTCKDALMIFSQNETLQLQKRVQELEERLAKYEPINTPIRVFDEESDWFEASEEIQHIIRSFIDKNVTACDENVLFDSHNTLAAVCDVCQITNMVSHAFEVIIGDKKLSDNLAEPYARYMNSLLCAILWGDHKFLQSQIQLDSIFFFETFDYIEEKLVSRKIIVWKQDGGFKRH